MADIKYYKRVEDSKLIFLRVTEVQGNEEFLLEDLEVVKLRPELRYAFGVNKMQNIKLDEFQDLMKTYNLGLTSQPLAEALQRI